MTAEPPRKLQLPQTVCGTADELDDIVLVVVGHRPQAQQPINPARTKDVTDRLRQLASTLLSALHEQAQSPSAQQLEAALARIQRLAEGLTEALFSLPPFSLDLFNAVYHAHRGWDPAGRRSVALGLGTAPAQLATSAIELTAKNQLEQWRDGLGQTGMPFNQRGPQRAYQRIIGDPRMFVADQVAQLIAREQGAKAISADVAGPLYDVVSRLWTYATGLPEEGANLRQYVRRAANRNKERAEAEDHALQLRKSSKYVFLWPTPDRPS